MFKIHSCYSALKITKLKSTAVKACGRKNDLSMSSETKNRLKKSKKFFFNEFYTIQQL